MVKCCLVSAFFHFSFLIFEFFTFGHVKGNARDGRSRHRLTNQSFRVCKVNLATLKVATSLMVDVEEMESLLGPVIRMWISDESCKKQRTKKVARYFRLSAQMDRVNSW